MTTTTPALPAEKIFDLAARAALLEAYLLAEAIFRDRGIGLEPAGDPGPGEALVMIGPDGTTLGAWSNGAAFWAQVTPGEDTAAAGRPGAEPVLATWEVTYGDGEFGGELREAGTETSTAVGADGEVCGTVWLSRFVYTLVEAANAEA